MKTIINEIRSKSLSGNTIKIIAIIAMIIDHVGWAFVETNSITAMIMHTIGKITGPIMFYYIAEGNHFSKNHKKYVDRLIMFSLISHIPYNIFCNYGRITLLPTSVIFTLLCALLALIVYEKVDRKMFKWGLITLLVGVTYWSDWAIWGVLFALCFGIFYGNKQKQWISYLAVNSIKIIGTFIAVGWNFYKIVPVVVSPFLVLAILNLYNGTKGGNKYSKWAFYIIYPLQFLIIGGLWLLCR
jgi:TraX protein.